MLPGSVQAFIEAPIYARTSGYLKSWYTDIGTPVKKGQLLAEIDTPEVDQQLRQAQADLATAQANYAARAHHRRALAGAARDPVGLAAGCGPAAGDAAAKAPPQQSAAANVARLRDLESFKRVLAPFDGVVTQRNTDIGALINAGQSPGTRCSASPTRTGCASTCPCRSRTRPRSSPGLTAELEFTEHPGKRYPATVGSTAHALDPASRTLQVELQIDNAGGELFPGSYAEVHFNLPARRQHAARAGEHRAVPRRGPAGGDRRPATTRAPEDHHAGARLRHGDRGAERHRPGTTPGRESARLDQRGRTGAHRAAAAAGRAAQRPDSPDAPRARRWRSPGRRARRLLARAPLPATPTPPPPAAYRGGGRLEARSAG